MFNNLKFPFYRVIEEEDGISYVKFISKNEVEKFYVEVKDEEINLEVPSTYLITITKESFLDLIKDYDRDLILGVKQYKKSIISYKDWIEVKHWVQKSILKSIK